MKTIQETVRERYARAALDIERAAGCCGEGACCDGGGCGIAYDAAEIAGTGIDASSSLGCGNPTALAALRPGEVVLDLGSGGGLDVLLSARRVLPGGRAYGVDMTDEMLALSEKNRRRAGVTNAAFLKGTIEDVPLPDASVDVVISNCVINLAEDKGAVLKEAFRLLRPGGRLAVADMVAVEPLEEASKADPEAWAECIAGAITVPAYERLLDEAGFEGVEIEVHATTPGPDGKGRVGSAHVRARKPAARGRSDG